MTSTRRDGALRHMTMQTERQLAEGDWLVSRRADGRQGTWYLIESVREVRRREPGPRKLALTCRTAHPGDPLPEDLVVHEFVWEPRARSRTRRWRR